MMNMQPLIKLWAPVALAATVGCASAPHVAEQTPLDPSRCRIVFKREGGMLGAMIRHYVVDDGIGSQKTALVNQKKQFSQELGNFDKAGNVTRLERDMTEDVYCTKIPFGNAPQIAHYIKEFGGVLKTNKELWSFQVNLGFELPLDLRGWRKIQSTDVSVELGNAAKQLRAPLNGHGTYLFMVPHADGTKCLLIIYGLVKRGVGARNAEFIGTVGSGKSLTWDRAPGTLRLQVITEGGDQAFSLPFNVEAGKTYRVNYHYAGARFDFLEENPR